MNTVRPSRGRSIRARLRYHLPVEASCEADDLRLRHEDIEEMTEVERWTEGARVTLALALLADAKGPIIMREGRPYSGRLWLHERLRLVQRSL